MNQFAQHHHLYDRFSQLIMEAQLSSDDMQHWARFMTVAGPDELTSIIAALEFDPQTITVLTANLRDKLQLSAHDTSGWMDLFQREKEYILLHRS